MSRRLVVVVWMIIAVAVWSGFFDLYISRGAREYLQLSAESELGRAPKPSMTTVMASARHAGAVAASSWALLIVVAGCGTALLAGNRRSRPNGR